MTDKIEVIKASCGHYIPKPSDWPPRLRLREALELARYVEPQVQLDSFETRPYPVLLCPDCARRVDQLAWEQEQRELREQFQDGPTASDSGRGREAPA